VEWVLGLASGLVTLLLIVPPLAVVAGVVVLWTAGLFGPASPVITRESFECPFSRRHARVEFLAAPGVQQPSDVAACSVFADPCQVTCEKKCLALAGVRSVATTMMPRFALLSGGVSYRG
jgi:hypothetical protein